MAPARSLVLIRMLAAVAVFAMAACLAVSSAQASAPGPPGQNTLFFGPSGNGGCSQGQVSALGEASTQWGTPLTPTNIAGVAQVVTNSNPLVATGATADGFPQTVDIYPGSMAATAWSYTGGYPWVFDGVAPSWATQVYFTNLQECGNTQWLYASCYSTAAANGYNPSTLIQCPYAGGAPTFNSPPRYTPLWVAYQAPSGSVVGGAVAVDTTQNIVYFTTVPTGCAGARTCDVSVWSAPAATSYGARLQPTAVGTLPGFVNPTEMAVDPIAGQLYIASGVSAQVLSLPTAPGGSPSVLADGGPFISASITGLAVDTATAMVYVLSAQTGAESNQIARVPETGCCITSMLTQGAMGSASISSALALDTANGFLAFASSPAAGAKAGNANTMNWAPLDNNSPNTLSSQSYAWGNGGPASSAIAYVQGMTIAGGVGTCQYQGASFPCPTTTVAAAGTTVRAGSDGRLAIPLRALRVRPEAAPGATSPTPASGPMVVTMRERASAGRPARTLATLRPGFSMRANSAAVRRVAIPAAARTALRQGRLEVRVQTRQAGTGQRWRTRVLRVLPR